MLAITRRLRERIMRYRREHRNCTAQFVFSSQDGHCIVRGPSLSELSERYPAGPKPYNKNDSGLQ
jgi:hypothetical protein